MEQLKIHVERIVRPIRATAWRKNKMREELLAHLMEKTEALVAAGAAEPDAATQAIQQLGDPATLRADLQASVPAIEGLACFPIPGRMFDAYFEKAEGESAFHYALVRTIFVGSFILLLVVLVWAARWSGLLTNSQRKVHSLSYCSMLLSFAYFSVVMATFVIHYATDVSGLRRVMSKKTPTPALVKGAAHCLFLFAYILLMYAPIVLFLWIVNPDDATILVSVFRGEFGRVLGFIFLLFLFLFYAAVSFALKYEHDQWTKWGNLRIDD
jgi:hypothetical protein